MLCFIVCLFRITICLFWAIKQSGTEPKAFIASGLVCFYKPKTPGKRVTTGTHIHTGCLADFKWDRYTNVTECITWTVVKLRSNLFFIFKTRLYSIVFSHFLSSLFSVHINYSSVMVPKPTDEQGAEHIASEDIDVITMQWEKKAAGKINKEMNSQCKITGIGIQTENHSMSRTKRNPHKTGWLLPHWTASDLYCWICSDDFWKRKSSCPAPPVSMLEHNFPMISDLQSYFKCLL